MQITPTPMENKKVMKMTPEGAIDVTDIPSRHYKPLGEKKYIVWSFNNNKNVYLVDLKALTCDCPDYINRNGGIYVGIHVCKHIKYVREMLENEDTLQK